jgi:hypothetical protein
MPREIFLKHPQNSIDSGNRKNIFFVTQKFSTDSKNSVNKVLDHLQIKISWLDHFSFYKGNFEEYGVRSFNVGWKRTSY